MSTSTPTPSIVSSEAYTGMLSTIYARAGSSALTGAFRAGSKTSRSAILSKIRFHPLPEDLLQDALESHEDEILWALSQRDDLPAEAIEALIVHDSPLVHRRLASNPKLTNEDLVHLLPGDEFVRHRVFTHPNASPQLRREILSARDASGMPLPRATALDQELMEPKYALWLLDSDTQQARMQALSHLPSLPASHQWKVAWRVAERAVPLSMAWSARGWVAPLHTALRESISALATGGEEMALGVLASNLQNLGAPPARAEDEARLLADEAEVDLLAAPNPLDWSSLEQVLRSGDMSIEAVRYLLQREDRTAGFTSAALVFHGDSVGVLPLCALKDLQAASAMSNFALTDRARLVKLIIQNPALPYPLLDMVAQFPISDVLAELQQTEAALAEYQLKRLGDELAARLGEASHDWEAFEEARLGRRSITFAGALAAVEGQRAGTN